MYNNGQKKLSTVCVLEHEKHSLAVLNVGEHIMKSVAAAKTNSCCSQTSGKACSSQRWYFQKPALSTSDSKLKAIR